MNRHPHGLPSHGANGRDEPAWRRYARLLRPDARSDINDEIEFHYHMRVRDYVARGMTEDQAAHAARQRLGNIDTARRDCMNVYERRRKRERMSELKQDVRIGARMLRRSPGFSIVAILTLALGIGATTAIFSVVYRLLLAPLPYPGSDRIVAMWEVSPKGNTHNVVSSGNYLDWLANARSFTGIAATQGASPVTLTQSGDARHVIMADLTPSATTVFRMRPLSGRVFNEADDNGVGDVILISEKMWRTEYGADPGAIGRSITLNSRSYTIVGVIPGSFEFPQAGVDVWRALPHSSFDATERRSHNYEVVARLADNVTPERAQQEMTNIAHGIASQHPKDMTGWDVNVIGLHDDLTGGLKPLLVVISLTVVLVLLIACGNLANLLLARGVARQREMALRGALGAARSRLVRQMLTESALLASAGGIAAVITAAGLLRVLKAIAPASLPLVTQISIDPAVLGFALALTIICTLLFGVAPALWVSRSDPATLLQSARGGSNNRRAGRARAALLVSEIALSAVLLAGAGLLLRSYIKVQSTDLGFDAAHLAVASVDLPSERYASLDAQNAFYQQLLDGIRSLPGVQSVAGSTHAPGSGNGMTFSFGIEGRVATNASGREDAEQMHAVTSDYFGALRIPLLQGRTFSDADRSNTTPVVIINRALARKHWPDANPVGSRISFRPGETPWLTIVGVVEDARFDSPESEPEPALFIPFAQRTNAWMTWLGVVVRMKNGTQATSVLPGIRSIARGLDDRIPIDALDNVSDLFGTTVARRTFALTLVAAFAALALVLTLVGLYGLMAYTVEQQKRDLSVRLALGAGKPRVLGAVVGGSMRLCALGLAIGIPLSLFLARFASTLLYGVQPGDPASLAASILIIAAICVLATLVPAARAAATEPMTALRLE